MNHLPPETIKMIRELVATGATARSVAKQTGVSPGTAKKYCAIFAEGLPIPPPPQPPNQSKPAVVERIRSFVRMGYSTRMIERKVGVDHRTAWHWMHVFKHEGPNCPHGINIYGCTTCAGGRRVLKDGALIIMHGQSVVGAVSQAHDGG